jgi:hypothetical protein
MDFLIQFVVAPAIAAVLLLPVLIGLVRRVWSRGRHNQDV